MPLRLLRAGLLTVFLGTLIAVLFLRRCIAHHQSRLVRALPGFLAIVALCLESGLGLHAALERASRRDRPHLKVLQVRVRRVLRGLSAGEAFPQAMQRGLEGIDPGPVRQFFEGLIHVDRLGGSLLSAVRGDMEALAEARRHEARERASSAGVALMVPLILLELPALLVLLLGPVMLPFVESFERLL
jgi:tight adherence protein C